VNVERSLDPSLRGQPVVGGGGDASSGFVALPVREARRAGFSHVVDGGGATAVPCAIVARGTSTPTRGSAKRFGHPVCRELPRRASPGRRSLRGPDPEHLARRPGRGRGDYQTSFSAGSVSTPRRVSPPPASPRASPPRGRSRAASCSSCPGRTPFGPPRRRWRTCRASRKRLKRPASRPSAGVRGRRATLAAIVGPVAAGRLAAACGEAKSPSRSRRAVPGAGGGHDRDRRTDRRARGDRRPGPTGPSAAAPVRLQARLVTIEVQRPADNLRRSESVSPGVADEETVATGAPWPSPSSAGGVGSHGPGSPGTAGAAWPAGLALPRPSGSPALARRVDTIPPVKKPAGTRAKKSRARPRPRRKAPATPPRARRAVPKPTPERAARILDRLEQAHPEARCALTHRNAFELSVATILSAQCTDERVTR
jgi:hypothetical protein